MTTLTLIDTPVCTTNIDAQDYREWNSLREFCDEFDLTASEREKVAFELQTQGAWLIDPTEGDRFEIVPNIDELTWEDLTAPIYLRHLACCIQKETDNTNHWKRQNNEAEILSLSHQEIFDQLIGKTRFKDDQFYPRWVGLHRPDGVLGQFRAEILSPDNLTLPQLHPFALCETFQFSAWEFGKIIKFLLGDDSIRILLADDRYAMFGGGDEFHYLDFNITDDFVDEENSLPYLQLRVLEGRLRFFLSPLDNPPR